MGYSVQCLATGRMSRKIILAMLGIASAAMADFNYTTCESLNVIKDKTHLLKPDAFSKKLGNCRDALNQTDIGLTDGAIALLQVYNAIHKDTKCNFTKEIEDQLIKCVLSVTGFLEVEFTAQTAKEHFGLNTTEALIFNSKTCKESLALSQCVDKTFSTEKVTFELKGCKDNIIRGFEVTAQLCEDVVIRLDKNSAFIDPPPYILIVSTAVMLAKLALFSRH